MLCRELKGLREMNCGGGCGVEVARARDESANFILRRAVPFLPKAREWQEVKRDDYYERSSTLEDKSRCGAPTTATATTKDKSDPKPKAPSSNGEQRQPAVKDVAHRTVIYFGDSNPRQRDDKPIWQPPPPPPSLPEISSRVPSKFKGNPETSPRNNDEVELHQGSLERNNGRDCNRECGDTDVTRDTENDPGKVVHEIVVNVSPSREDVLRIEEDESQLEDYWSLPGDTSGFKADWSFVQQWRLRG